MDRRKFLQASIGLSVTAALPSTAFSGECFAANLPNCAADSQSSMLFKKEHRDQTPRIGVIAVGIDGCELLSSLNGRLPHLCRPVAIDFSSYAFEEVSADRKILIPYDGMNSSGNHRATKSFAKDTKLRITEAVADLDIAFIVAGMGGLAGTDIVPAVAELLREQQIFSIAAAISPCTFENLFHHQVAQASADKLCRIANAVFPINCEWSEQGLSPTEFERLYRGITLPFSEPGLVNLDVDDVISLMSNGGRNAMGYGSAKGKDAAEIATRQAITYPLLGARLLSTASGILISIEGPPTSLARLGKVCRIFDTVRDAIGYADHDQVLVCGAIRNETLVDEFRVTILAGGVLAKENGLHS